jgi:hypothetical protein
MLAKSEKFCKAMADGRWQMEFSIDTAERLKGSDEKWCFRLIAQRRHPLVIISHFRYFFNLTSGLLTEAAFFAKTDFRLLLKENP